MSYDRACDLLDANQRLHGAAEARAAAPAIAATLRCVEASLDQLCAALACMRGEAERVARRPAHRMRAHVAAPADAGDQYLHDAQRALHDMIRSTAAPRAAIGPLIADLTLSA